MQDNDPKHTSRMAAEYMQINGIDWWKTPPESPDCNPIENLWHELKEFLRREIKPKSEQELIDGICAFWRTVDAAKYRKYIGHLKKSNTEGDRTERSRYRLLDVVCPFLSIVVIVLFLLNQCDSHANGKCQ